MTTRSPFLENGTHSSPSSLAVLHLRRDQLIPVILDDGLSGKQKATYAEGEVINTRFGSFPHSTLIGHPWGSQVLASKVDTGSRGRKGILNGSTKRKSEELGQHLECDEINLKKPKLGDDDTTLSTSEASASLANRGVSEDNWGPKIAITAQSGFCHILPPTPESWTISLPHRTQVVYTPDYSLILQRLRIRPGSVVLEAGAGSGSFTHAAARAVYQGSDCRKSGEVKEKREGRVYSFEYHAPRAEWLQNEIKSHNLADIVQVTHRDVYEDGFRVAGSDPKERNENPNATAVFLDLPAPWRAFSHLNRDLEHGSPLSTTHPIHLCCFLPCIEQVHRAVTALQNYGWLEIQMEELQHRRLDVRRERVGLQFEGMRGVNATPATVEESVTRLVEVETRNVEFRDQQNVQNSLPEDERSGEVRRETKLERRTRIANELGPRKPWTEGNLIYRTEPEMKTHTSYLVFATLPTQWSKERELKCRKRWPVERTIDSEVKRKGPKGGIR